MKCPNCKSVLSLKSNRCERCGEDVRIYKRVVKASNAYYNQGLMKAKIRDLSGAVIALRKSLELDKNNTNARNLLGLVYYEMGETVIALREWVVSKHLQENDNAADEYISVVQSNPTKLENTNQAIKKYNQALASAKQDNGDLAIIQLKKVVALNPKFIRAYQLLALLYLQQGDKEKASKVLAKANAIDINNTTTIRYMQEAGISVAKPVKEVKEERKEKRDIREIKNPDYNVFDGLNGFKEDKPSILPWLNLIIGVIVGVVACYVLIKPTMTNTRISELNEANKKYQTQVSNLQSKYDSANSEKEQLQKQIEELNNQKAENPAGDNGATSNDPATDVLLQCAEKLLKDKKADAAVLFATVNEESLTTDAQKALYNTIKGTDFSSAATDLYKKGNTAFNKGKYEEAVEYLTQATALKEDYAHANYVLGKAYMKLEQNDKAREVLQKLVDDHPNTTDGKNAKLQLNKLPAADSESASPSPSPSAGTNE